MGEPLVGVIHFSKEQATVDFATRPGQSTMLSVEKLQKSQLRRFRCNLNSSTNGRESNVKTRTFSWNRHLDENSAPDIQEISRLCLRLSGYSFGTMISNFVRSFFPFLFFLHIDVITTTVFLSCSSNDRLLVWSIAALE